MGKGKGGKYECVCGTDFHRHALLSVSASGTCMSFRFAYFAKGHILRLCNHFIMAMEIGFNFRFSVAAC